MNETQGTSNTESAKSLTLEEKAENILNRSIAFGPEEYKNLSKEDLNILREYTKNFFRHSMLSSTIYPGDHKDFYHIIFGKMCSDILHEKYPDGFTFVSVGRSPAHVAKYLEFQGEDVKYCPASRLCDLEREEDVDSFAAGYKKYLDSIGLTQEFVETTQKPIIVTDYCYGGLSLATFEEVLHTIFDDKNNRIKCIPLTPCKKFEGYDKAYDDYILDNDIYESWLEGQYGNKRFASIPKYYVKRPADEFFNEKYYKNGNRFEETLDAKMMNFAIADSIYRN